MHKIQSIEPRRRHLARVCLAPPPDLTVYEEDRRSLLPELENGQPLVDRTIIERLNLAVGDALSANDVQQLVKVSLCFRAKERAVWHLASADYSARGLYQKLRPVFGAVPAEFAVTQMRQRGYLNDEHYAERLAQAFNAKGLSARAATQKMQQKGLERAVAEAAVQRFFTENEEEKATALVLKRYAQKITDPQDIRKTTAALVRRGFSFSAARAAIAAARAQIAGKV